MAGALLVTLAALGVFLVLGAGDADSGHEYFVATRPLEVGDRIQPTDLSSDRMKLSDAVERESFDAEHLLLDAVVISPLNAGQLIQQSDISPARATSDGALGPSHEVSFPFDRDHAPDRLERGEQIAILATVSGSGESATRVVVSDAVVLNHETGDDSFGVGTGKLTVSVTDPSEALALAHVAHTAELTIVRQTHATEPLPPQYDTDRLGDPIRPAEATADPESGEAGG